MKVSVEAPTAQEMFDLAISHRRRAAARLFDSLIGEVQAAASEGEFYVDREFGKEKLKFLDSDLEDLAKKFRELGYYAYTVTSRQAVVVKWDSDSLRKMAEWKAKHGK